MTKDEFLERIEAVDGELVLKNVPIHQRSLQALRLMAPEYEGPILTSTERVAAFLPYVGPKLLASISEWYERRYGNARVSMPTVGRIPLEVKGQVFLAVIPVVYGSPRLTLPHIFSFVEHLTPDMVASLSEREALKLAEDWLRGYELTYEMEGCRGCLTGGAATLLASAFLDRDASVRALDQNHPDLPNACFHAQQLAEKALKAFLLSGGGLSEPDLKVIGHKLPNLLKKSLEVSRDFSTITPDIAVLDRITMDVRYAPPPLRPQDAVNTIWAALRVAGLVACKILGCDRRYRGNTAAGPERP